MATDDSTGQGFLFDTGEPLRRCAHCRRQKPMSAFGRRRRRGRLGYRVYCKECEVIRQLAWIHANPERKHKIRRRSLLRGEFGLSLEDYDRMAAAQGGLCAICGREQRKVNQYGIARYLAVDHDHRTGRVRGLLCSDCNAGLGLLQDSPAILEAALAYLRKHA